MGVTTPTLSLCKHVLLIRAPGAYLLSKHVQEHRCCFVPPWSFSARIYFRLRRDKRSLPLYLRLRTILCCTGNYSASRHQERINCRWVSGCFRRDAMSMRCGIPESSLLAGPYDIHQSSLVTQSWSLVLWGR